MTEAELVLFDDTAPAWERAFYAFLAEKERRSGSKRTVDAYSRTLQRFFGTIGKPPDQVTSQEVFVFAHRRGPSGRERAGLLALLPEPAMDRWVERFDAGGGDSRLRRRLVSSPPDPCYNPSRADLRP